MSLPSVSEWADIMPQTITIEPWASFKDGGTGSNYGTAYTSACRIEMRNHQAVTKDGRTVTARGRVYLLSLTIPSIKDRVTLPSEYTPNQPPIIDVNVDDDETGNHHITLVLG